MVLERTSARIPSELREQSRALPGTSVIIVAAAGVVVALRRAPDRGRVHPFLGAHPHGRAIQLIDANDRHAPSSRSTATMQIVTAPMVE